ncbi:MAG: Uncharacterised protein [Synechococcus sp. CC9902]|nr:MAG: Uncharacterised protein [Synechococcus sp. CC9902]
MNNTRASAVIISNSNQSQRLFARLLLRGFPASLVGRLPAARPQA